MGKRPDPRIKAQLIERIAAYILRHGLQDLSLRPLADALETTARMLIYHFGSREQLIVEVLTHGQSQQQAIFERLLVGGTRPADGLRALWQHFTSEALTPLIRLSFEVEVLAMQGKTEYLDFRSGHAARLDHVDLGAHAGHDTRDSRARGERVQRVVTGCSHQRGSCKGGRRLRSAADPPRVRRCALTRRNT
ncbi:MAG: TetR/AcrR family transcriptional regulator [Pleurocapsa sp. SU_196_0]|nr:TetR/AcrR family transcriptional regulator [Pleurocapsa sp. SU_196_0]